MVLHGQQLKSILVNLYTNTFLTFKILIAITQCILNKHEQTI